MAFGRFCKHGNLRLTCGQCRQDEVLEAGVRAQENRRRGESGVVGRVEGAEVPYPWQREGLEAWKQAGRSGLVALSLGLPQGDLAYAAMADVVNDAPTTNVLFACQPSDVERVRQDLQERFGLHPSSLADHHFLEPKDDGTLLVADLEELQTVDLGTWGRFATNGLLVQLDADGVGPHLGQLLLEAPFRHRFAVSRKPSAPDLLLSRPWVRAFGPLVYRYTEDQARDLGVLPRIQYKVHVEMLRPEPDLQGPEGPWETTDIPTRLPGFQVGNFAKGRARDVAIRRCKEQEGLVVLHDGVPIPGARATLRPSELPERYDTPPSGWLLAFPYADMRTVMRVATTAWKTLEAPGLVEDAVVLPVPADLSRIPPWDDRWRAAAAQIDRVVIGLLLAQQPGEAMLAEDLEALVGVALALRGLPPDDLYALTPVVAEAAMRAHAAEDIPPQRVAEVARAYGGLAAALLVGAAAGPMQLLRIAHPRFTPVIPDLPHPSLFDAAHHQWRGKAFAALAQAASRADLVTAWGRYPELRFVFPSSSLLEAATHYCRAHKVKGPLQGARLTPIPDRTRIATGDRAAATEVLKVWRNALGRAEEHEREFLADMHARQPERERRREGSALPGLDVVETRPDTLVLESTQGRFPPTNISPGSEVTLVEAGEREELARGLVSRISARRITVEFPQGAPRRLPRRVTVNLVFDAKVFEAYHAAVLGALRAMVSDQPHDDGPDGLLRSMLLGEEGERLPTPDVALDDLTPSQREAIQDVLRGGRVRLIHGPPGTGKTHTLVRLSMALTRAGHSVLVTADSNAAVDNLVVGLRRQGALVVRIGHAPNLRDEAAEPARIDPLDAPLFVRWAAEQGIVVATTNYGAFRYIDAKGSMGSFLFDYVIHDEAGQATAPSSLAAVMRGRRLVLAGDPKQLPPTVVSLDAKDAGLDVTLFERIEELTGHGRTDLLATQFRMREPILAFSNKRYYDGRIETDPGAAAQEGLPDVPAAAFQHVTGRENDRQRNGSISNDYEVAAVAHLLQAWRREARDRGWTIAVLTPYQAQRERLRRALPDIEVSTVDGAQGREWDIVFYSSVRSNPKHRLGFVADERRLNVAVTRAKRNFILVGDERTLRDHEGFAQLLDGMGKIRMFYPDRDTPNGLDPRTGVGRRRGRGGERRPRPDNPPAGRGPARRPHPPQAAGNAQPGADAGTEEGGGRRRRRRRRGKRGGRPDIAPPDQAGGTPQGDASPGQDRAAGQSEEGSPGRRSRGRRRKRNADETPSTDGSASQPADAPAQPARPRRRPRSAGQVAARPDAGAPAEAQAPPERADRAKADQGAASKKKRPATDKESATKKAPPAGKPAAAKGSPAAKKGPARAGAAGGKAKAAGAAPCSAVTKTGQPCKNKARPGASTCARHG